jgi:hypothetical protein
LLAILAVVVVWIVAVTSVDAAAISDIRPGQPLAAAVLSHSNAVEF